MQKKHKVLLIANTAWYIANFRSELIRTLQIEGYEVVAAAPSDDSVKRIEALGCRFVHVPMDNGGTSPVKDLRLLLDLYKLFARERPAVFLGYTVKPNVYGSLAARWLGIPAINNIAGLGTAFIRESWLTRMVEKLYRSGLAKSAKVFFQNNDDLQLFIQRTLVNPLITGLLPGSGVDTRRFAPDFVPMYPASHTVTDAKPFRFLLSARLLRDKGVVEFVEAARMLLTEGYKVECQLLGFMDVANRTAISRQELDDWEKADLVRYLGAVDDVRPHLAGADCVVLPSYREGMPRSLLEAASMAKPIITTDAPGCRNVIDSGTTGLLCRPRDAADLADKMRIMLQLPKAELQQMGRKGREKMLREFDEKIVLDQYLQAIQAALSGK